MALCMSLYWHAVNLLRGDGGGWIGTNAMRSGGGIAWCARAPFLAVMNREKLIKMAGAVRTGGKGSVRRKKKAVHKTATTDDKRLQSTLKRIGVNAIPAIEEVNIFKDDIVIQFVNPKGPDNLDNLRRLAEQFQKQAPGAGAAQEEDDEVPELVAGETFEAAADESHT
ncbi:hypothetical protein HHK36_014621 [Tetracentron sinense]|uniref:Nascent polypeptide-associated complex subunit beta n=1 Tax=Tetracentron sinense TaxID=13715 RepID=A0A835DC39_TETSI|nr:hypothetical protein HHK36_014621 [Tetracentron sinense]